MLSCIGFASLLPLAPQRLSAESPASFYKDVQPILKRSCQGCHHPGKHEGELDLTSYATFAKGGKTDKAFEPGHPEKSLIIDMIKGEKPPMPKKA
ncbi:hypothetical protein HYR69_10125, partial [Candidatus Sumerlaeota bacterium]|nr:hypothetical protein [Candidatus Sumerlaeota bacterium]